MDARVLPVVLVSALVGPHAGPPTCDVSGAWNGSFGSTILHMTPEGFVSGNYTWQGGRLSGIVTGSYVNGTWSEGPTYGPPRDTGTFSWHFNDDCSGFTGSYFYSGTPGSPAGVWSGSRANASEAMQVPEARGCDPAGTWTTSQGDLHLAAGDSARDLQGNWTKGAERATLTGAFVGLKYAGTWQTPSEPTARPFVMVFDADCNGFQGSWSTADRVNRWTGQRTALPPAPAPPALKPEDFTTPGLALGPPSPATPPPPAGSVGPKDDKPLGVPGVPLAALLPAALGLALLLRGRRR